MGMRLFQIGENRPEYKGQPGNLFMLGSSSIINKQSDL